ncbi:MAG: tetratricopeptide repeat protein [Spirosomataceae bacterium]
MEKEEDPKTKQALFGQCVCVIQGKFAEGLQECQKALEIFPEYLGAMVTMAIAYINLNQK